MADVVGQVPGQLPTFTSGHNPQAGVPGGGTVTSISGVSPIATVPSPIVGAGTVEFPSWPVDAPGQLTNDGAGVLSWTTDVGAFVRLLADPTIDQDVGGFHVTLSGLSDTAFLVNTLTNPGDAKFRALGTTDDFIELEYTTAAANSYSGLRLQGPAARTLEINLFGSGTSGVAHGWDGTVYDLPAGSALYGAGVDAHWFKLSGSADYTGSFQLYDNGANFFPALSLVSIDGGAAVGAVTVGANTRVNAIPPDFSVFHGATTATGLGTERIRITNDDSEGPGTAKLVFGNLPAFATMSGNTSRDFQFVGNVANTNLLLNSNGPGTSQFSLYSLDGSGNGDGIHLICYAQDGVEPSEYAAFNVGAFERWQIPYTGTAILSDNTEFILEANYAGGLDGQLCLYSARVGNTATTDTRVTFGAESQAGADADFVLYTGGTESLRISGATKKVTMPGVLDPPEIDVINKTPSDTATASVFMAATDSGANTSNVSVGIELATPPSAGDLVFRAGGAGAATPGVEVLRLYGSGGFVPVIGAPAATLHIEPDFYFNGFDQMYVLDTDFTFSTQGAVGGSINLSATAGAVSLIANDPMLGPMASFQVKLDRTIQTFGTFLSNGDAAVVSTGTAATALIGTGTDGTVNLVADAPGIAGNGFTVEVVEAAGANDNSSASFTLQALTVTLGKTGGVLDPAKNTATIIAGLINTEAGGVTATASGTGDDPLTGAEGPTTFAGGAESLTLAGSANAAGYKVSALQTAPASASAAGVTGDIRWASDAVYLCIAADTWVKAILATWI